MDVTRSFYIYPKDISKFIEYCERFGVIESAEIKLLVNKEKGEDDYFIIDKVFICNISFFSQLDALRFSNICSLFFVQQKTLLQK